MYSKICYCTVFVTTIVITALVLILQLMSNPDVLRQVMDNPMVQVIFFLFFQGSTVPPESIDPSGRGNTSSLPRVVVTRHRGMQFFFPR